MTNEEIFEIVKDKFAGVRMVSSTEMMLLTTDGQEYKVVNQNEFDVDYDIRFYCHGDTGSCNEDCQAHGSERWEISKRLHIF